MFRLGSTKSAHEPIFFIRVHLWLKMNYKNQETEVKFYVRNLPDIEMRLHSLEAHLLEPRAHEVNLRFDTSTGDFQREGRVLRLRRDEAVHLTYKDQSQLKDGALTRREIEFEVSDFDSARQFVEALGYKVIFMYEKYRTTYELDGAHIMLDEMPIGGFIEVEGELHALRPIAQKLGLNWNAAVPASYHALFERVCQARGLTFRDLSFENFKGMKILPGDLGILPAVNRR